MSTIKVDTIQTRAGAVPKASDLGLNTTGNVIQTVTTGTIALTQITSTGSWTDTNYTLSITPQFSDSKILFQSANHFRLGGSTPIRGGVRIQRTVSSTDTIVWNSSNNTEHFQVRNADNEHDTIGSISFLDSPATTSSVTYLIQIYLHTGTFMNIYESGHGGGIVLQEIAG